MNFPMFQTFEVSIEIHPRNSPALLGCGQAKRQPSQLLPHGAAQRGKKPGRRPTFWRGPGSHLLHGKHQLGDFMMFNGDFYGIFHQLMGFYDFQWDFPINFYGMFDGISLDGKQPLRDGKSPGNRSISGPANEILH